jgi:hypothetical protein
MRNLVGLGLTAGLIIASSLGCGNSDDGAQNGNQEVKGDGQTLTRDYGNAVITSAYLASGDIESIVRDPDLTKTLLRIKWFKSATPMYLEATGENGEVVTYPIQHTGETLEAWNDAAYLGYERITANGAVAYLCDPESDNCGCTGSPVYAKVTGSCRCVIVRFTSLSNCQAWIGPTNVGNYPDFTVCNTGHSSTYPDSCFAAQDVAKNNAQNECNGFCWGLESCEPAYEGTTQYWYSTIPVDPMSNITKWCSLSQYPPC